MYLRVPFLVAILATRALDEFVILLAPAFIVSAIASWILYRRAPKSSDSAAPGNPIAILPALGFLAFVAFAAVAARWAQGRFGEEGIAVLLLIVGSTDVDAAIITLGGLDPNAIGAPLAALALAGTVRQYGREARHHAGLCAGQGPVRRAGAGREHGGAGRGDRDRCGCDCRRAVTRISDLPPASQSTVLPNSGDPNGNSNPCFRRERATS